MRSLEAGEDLDDRLVDVVMVHLSPGRRVLVKDPATDLLSPKAVFPVGDDPIRELRGDSHDAPPSARSIASAASRFWAATTPA